MLHSLANTVLVVNVDSYQQRFQRVYVDRNHGHVSARENVDQ